DDIGRRPSGRGIDCCPCPGRSDDPPWRPVPGGAGPPHPRTARPAAPTRGRDPRRRCGGTATWPPPTPCRAASRIHQGPSTCQEPRGENMLRTHEAGTLRPEHVGTTVTLTGWIARRRDHGGVAFVDLRDASGVVQVVARDEVLTGTAHDLRNEYCVKVVGEVTARADKDVNPDLPTGGVDVVATDIEVLSESAPLPFQIDE